MLSEPQNSGGAQPKLYTPKESTWRLDVENPICVKDEIKVSIREVIFEEKLAEDFPELKRDMSP